MRDLITLCEYSLIKETETWWGRDWSRDEEFTSGEITGQDSVCHACGASVVFLWVSAQQRPLLASWHARYLWPPN